MNYFKDWTQLVYGKDPVKRVGYLWFLREMVRNTKESYKSGFILFLTDKGPAQVDYREKDTVDDILIMILEYLYVYGLKYDQ